MRSGSARSTEALQEKVQAVSKEVDVRKLEWSSGRNECSTEEGELRSRLGACFKKRTLWPEGAVDRDRGADGACEESHK